jgi:hypothetical protein
MATEQSLHDFLRERGIPNRFTCGRRTDLFAPGADKEFEDSWRDDGTCSYCGSVNPDWVMNLAEQGKLQFGPTDKNYKAYVRWMKDGSEVPKEDPDPQKDFAAYQTFHVASESHKFYFQHFNEGHKKRFIDLYNSGRMKIGHPGYFYSGLFFCQYVNVAKP